MNLAPTAEQQELQASTRRFLAKEVTRERLAAWDREPDACDAGFWREVAELGWIGFTLPERSGGGGASLVDAALILEECGRALAPTAIHAAIVGGRALAAIGGGMAAAGLPSIARGERRVTLAVAEAEDAVDFERFGARIENGKLSGEKRFVRHGATADWLVVAALDGGRPALAVVPARERGVERHELRTFGRDRQCDVRFTNVPVERDAMLVGDEAVAALHHVRDEETALALAEAVGGATVVVEMTVAYVKERVQFGQPLGKFQGVQFICADMATALAGIRHASWRAIWRLSEGLDASAELAVARAHVAGAFKKLTLDAHQLHGGAGFVIEHPLQRHSERAVTLGALFAVAEDGLEAVAADLFR